MTLNPLAVSCPPGRLRVDGSGHPLPGESVLGVTPDTICQALRQGDSEKAFELTRTLQKAAQSGAWSVQEPDGSTYGLQVASTQASGSDLMHLLRNGVVMRLARDARQDPELKSRLAGYERLLSSMARAPVVVSQAPLPAPTTPLLAEECERVLLGMADAETSERVRGALLHRFEVHDRNRQEATCQDLRQRLAGDPSSLVEVLGELQVDHPEFVGQHMIFRSAASLGRWLGIPMEPTLEPARQVVVVGGVHGNELSGTEAAERIQAEGDPRVRVFPKANPWAQGTRTSEGVDMNRIFPGRSDGSPEERQAHQIFQAASGADVVIDLHEAMTEWRDGRAGRLCLFQPTPRSLAFLHRMQPYLDRHDFRLVPYRYPGSLVQEVSRSGPTVGLLFEVPLTLDFEARTRLAGDLTRAAMQVAFQPEREP